MEQFLQTLIRDAGAMGLKFFRDGVTNITTKSHPTDFLSEADQAVSAFIVESIEKAYPDHAICSEELDETLRAGAEYEWVIDPIDGTANFVAGLPFWCISIGVLRNGERYLAALFNPISGDLFFAKKGEGAYLNDKRIHVGNKENLNACLGIFVRANAAGVYGTHTERYQRAYLKLVSNTTAWIKNFGTIFGQVFVANGGFDFAVGNAGMDWDFVAFFLIAEEAGAIVTDSDGNPWQRGRQDYIVANPYLHAKFLEMFREL